MNVLYVCKVSANQASGNQIDIAKKIGINFFGFPESYFSEKKNYSISICHIRNVQSFETIELQPATNLRFSTRLNTFLAENGDDIANGDLLVFEKLVRAFCVRCIKSNDSKYNALYDLFDEDEKHMLISADLKNALDKLEETRDNIKAFLPAMRTKPFLLLAGISGTGKSQIVKEMAFATCPDLDDLRENEVSPGNYCLIEVKPNWHDSTELLGYDSAIKKQYIITPFVKFVVKAMKYPKVPFFICLDEMNLAPVEQYFAEFLSVLESRKLVDDKIISEPLIRNSFFKNNMVALDLFDLPITDYKGLSNVTNVEFDDEILGDNVDIWHKLQDEGLCIPQNLIVIGTVNMDETTHQFSRKVIDRAMTFEMNEADFSSYFKEKVTLDYVNEPMDADLFLSRDVSGNNAIKRLKALKVEELKANVITVLGELNDQLKDTPFKIAYRVQNELVIYFVELMRGKDDADQAALLDAALDEIMMMKVLPRIEGDDELLGTRTSGTLHDLKEFAINHNLVKSQDKIEEMLKRLDRSHFTSFWP